MRLDSMIAAEVDACPKCGPLLTFLYALRRPFYFLGVGQAYKDLAPFQSRSTSSYPSRRVRLSCLGGYIHDRRHFDVQTPKPPERPCMQASASRRPRRGKVLNPNTEYTVAIADALRSINWGRWDVEYVVLFGSAARGGAYEDVDLAVYFAGEPDLAAVAEIADAASKATGNPHVDVVVLNWDVPCALMEEIYTKGVLIYAKSRERYIDDLAKRLAICWDFEISYRKLHLLETALRAVKSRWQS